MQIRNLENCTHSNYKLSPVFKGPSYEKKHVEFSTILDLRGTPLTFFQKNFHWFFSCSEQETQVALAFSCMQYLYPAPTGWETNKTLIGLNSAKIITHYCIDQGKAVISYIRPERNPGEFRSILNDMCEGYVIVHSYKALSRKEEFAAKTVSYREMKSYFDTECKTQIIKQQKPSFCFAEYRFNDDLKKCNHYKLDCTDNILMEAFSDRSCDSSVEPEYRIHKESYSPHGQFASFAAISYLDSIGFSLVDDWTHIKSSGGSHGFYGHAFSNKKLQLTIIVFRGTDDFEDWTRSNICFAFPGCEPSQFKIALDFFDSIKSTDVNSHDYVVVGHSLGGALAALVSIARDIKAVTFDAPGIFYAANKLFNPDLIESSANRITSYIFGVNVVNSAGKHITDHIQVTESIIEDCSKDYASYTFAQHNITKGINYFNKDTGHPIYSKHVSKDTLTFGYFISHLKSQCKKELLEFQEKVFECTRMLFETDQEMHARDTLTLFRNSTIQVIKSMPILKKDGLCGTKEIKLVGEQYFEFLEIKKEVVVAEIKYELPMSLESYISNWDLLDHNSALNVAQVTFTSTFDNFELFRDKILADETLRQKYQIYDCTNEQLLSHPMCGELAPNNDKEL